MTSEKTRLLTVSEYAKAEGLSRQAIYRRIKSSDKWMTEHCQVVDGRLYVDLTTFPEEQEPDVDNIDSTIDKEVDKKIDELTIQLTALERENALLREEIVEKNKQIQDLIQGWRESQAASAMKQLEQPSSMDETEPEEQKRRSVLGRLLMLRRK